MKKTVQRTARDANPCLYVQDTLFFFLQLKLLSAQAANTNYKPVKKQVVDLIS